MACAILHARIPIEERSVSAAPAFMTAACYSMLLSFGFITSRRASDGEVPAPHWRARFAPTSGGHAPVCQRLRDQLNLTGRNTLNGAGTMKGPKSSGPPIRRTAAREGCEHERDRRGAGRGDRSGRLAAGRAGLCDRERGLLSANGLFLRQLVRRAAPVLCLRHRASRPWRRVSRIVLPAPSACANPPKRTPSPPSRLR